MYTFGKQGELSIIKKIDETEITIKPHGYLTYLTIEAVEDSTFFIQMRSTPLISRRCNLQYSLDNGATWNEYAMPNPGLNGPSVSISAGSEILLKGNNPDGFNECYEQASVFYNNLAYYIQGSGKYKVHGNLMSLIYGDDFVLAESIPNDGCFGRLFLGNTALVEHELYFVEDTNKLFGTSIFLKCSNIENDIFTTTMCTDSISLLFYNRNISGTFDISTLKTKGLTSLHGVFGGTNLSSIIGLDKIDTSNIKTIYYMCNNCKSLEKLEGLSNWNTSNIVTMRAAFQNCNILKNLGNLSNWNTSNVNDISYMFNKCHELNSVGDLSNWNTSNVTTIQGMFTETYNIETLDFSDWDTSNVTLFNHFIGISNTSIKEFNLPIPFNYKTIITGYENWNTSKGTNFSWMFQKMNNMDHWDISKWDLSNADYENYGLGGMFAMSPNMETPKCKYIKLPDVPFIAPSMFINQISLEYIDFSKCTKVPSLIDLTAFKNVPSTCELRVPSALLDEWKQADNWKSLDITFVGV